MHEDTRSSTLFGVGGIIHKQSLSIQADLCHFFAAGFFAGDFAWNYPAIVRGTGIIDTEVLTALQSHETLQLFIKCPEWLADRKDTCRGALVAFAF